MPGRRALLAGAAACLVAAVGWSPALASSDRRRILHVRPGDESPMLPRSARAAQDCAKALDDLIPPRTPDQRKCIDRITALAGPGVMRVDNP